MGDSLIDRHKMLALIAGMNELGRARLQKLVDDQHEGDMKAASLAAGLGATYVRDVLKREKNGRSAEMRKLAASLKVTLDYLLGSQAGLSLVNMQDGELSKAAEICVAGKVGAGLWFEVGSAQRDESFAKSMFPPDPNYPLSAQFDLEVSGSSMNRIAADGDLLRCVRLGETNLSPRNGDVVVVERVRDGGALVEMTAKLFYKLNGRTELRPCSNDERWQDPVVLEEDDQASETVTVTALVLYKYKPLSR